MPTGTQGTQAWDRYAFVNNNPVRYNDPTGHGVDCGIGEGCMGNQTNPNDSPAHELSNTELGTTETEEECGKGGRYDCPQDGKHTPYIQEPDFSLHPTNFAFAPEIGRVLIYSPDGIVIGYQIVWYVPDNYEGIDLNADTSWSDMVGFGFAVGAELLGYTPVSRGILVLTGLNLLNNMVLFGGHLQTSDVIYLPAHPIEPPTMQFPDPLKGY